MATTRLLVGSCLVLGLIVSAADSWAATYYVDNINGADQNTGLSPNYPWQSIGRANQQAYGPGDRVLLKRGGAWHGPGFKANGSGSDAAPIVLGDYGDANLPRPIIDGVGPHEPAVLLQNVQHWVIRNLELTQHGQIPQNLDPDNKGKDADQYSDEYMRAIVHVLGLGEPGNPNCGEGCTVRDIRLENLWVHDGSWNGIYASGGYYQLRSDRYGFLDNVVVQSVESAANHKAGVEITCTYYQERVYAASNVWVVDSRLHHNGGDGAMVGPVRNGVLEGNWCAYNGQVRNARVGCWTWDSENTVIQFNESCFNRTPLADGKARDGAGFDLDLGTENGLIQYNWSHDNEGEGYLFVSWPVGFGYSRGESHNAHMRYNLSERDGKKLAGGITVFGGVAPLVVYNNIIYYEPNRLAGTEMFNGEGGAFTSSIWGRSGRPDVRAYNNIFIVNGRTNSAAASNTLWSDGAGIFAFDNNIWWRVEGGVRFQWGSTAVNSWTSWQQSGYDLHGFNTAPNLSGVIGSGPGAYRALPGAVGIDRGREVSDGLRGMGLQDAAGATIPQGSSFDIGAWEYRVLAPDPAAALMRNLQLQPDGTRQVEFQGAPGRAYGLQATEDLRSWRRVGWAVELGTGLYQAREQSGSGRRFYRAIARGMPGIPD